MSGSLGFVTSKESGKECQKKKQIRLKPYGLKYIFLNPYKKRIKNKE